MRDVIRDVISHYAWSGDNYELCIDDKILNENQKKRENFQTLQLGMSRFRLDEFFGVVF